MAQYLHDQRYVQSASMTRAFSRILSIVGPSMSVGYPIFPVGKPDRVPMIDEQTAERTRLEDMQILREHASAMLARIEASVEETEQKIGDLIIQLALMR
jgi:hypothetical protein